jgi:hypothetical protein
MTARTLSAQREPAYAHKVFYGFVAGFIAVLLFHQPALALLTEVGIAKATVYSARPTAPFGVPQVVSIAFWGGVWGIVFAAIEHRFPRGLLYWLCAFCFGAIFPTLVAWFVVAPLKGLPIAGGWQSTRMITGLVINGAWGLGTALLLAVAGRVPRGGTGA